MSELMADWTKIPGADKTGDVYSTDWQFPRRTQQQRWNDRIDATNKIISQIASGNMGSLVVEYRLAGEPAGLMAMSRFALPDHLISDLVTHPGTENAGGILIEYAVAMIISWQSGGRLELCAADHDAKQAYLKLGFKVVQGMEMLLDWARSPLWVPVGPVYKLAKYQKAGTYAA